MTTIAQDKELAAIMERMESIKHQLALNMQKEKDATTQEELWEIHAQQERMMEYVIDIHAELIAMESSRKMENSLLKIEKEASLLNLN